MRAFIDGKLSEEQSCFLPSSLWFATEDCEDNTEISDDCIRLDGLHTEGKTSEQLFTCMWKGVELCYIDEYGEYVETEEFTVDDFMKIIKDRNMRLVNIDVYADTDTIVEITDFVLEGPESMVEFDTDLIDNIEVIATE